MRFTLLTYLFTLLLFTLGAAADTAQEWLVGVNENSPLSQLSDASQFLTSLTGAAPKQVLRSDGMFLFWLVNMTEDQRQQALSHPSINIVELNLKLVDSRVPRKARPSPKARRDAQDPTTYKTQTFAPRELAAVSQPKGVPDLNLFKNYVYDGKAGGKSFIYHVEYGVAYKRYSTEFPHVANSILTPNAASQGKHGDDDNSGDHHSTCSANKALGQLYGVAKAATLVPVILADDRMSELIAAFQEVAVDLKQHPDRQGFSVVSVSMTSDGPGGRQGALLSRAITEVMRADVPVVVAAGNYAEEEGRENIDTFPAMLASREWPLIVVGSCGRAGARSSFSQVGDELTIYAVGEDSTCFEGADTPSTDVDGTSFAAPLVAGQVAIWLSYDTPPIDTGAGNLVRNMRDYLKTHPDAGWERSAGIRSLWNSVSEGENRRFLQCTGLAGNKYVERETLRAALEDDFCNLDRHTSPVSRRYHQGTMEDVIVDFRFYTPGSDDDRLVSREACVEFLLAPAGVTDGCDGNDPEGNPSNYKGGGSATLQDDPGSVQYRIMPQAYRQPAVKGPLGAGQGCDCTSLPWIYNDFVVWGHGWLSGDFGQALKDKVADSCHLRDNTWRFNYGLGDDGREWTAWFRTDPSMQACVQYVAKSVGAHEDFQCTGC